MKTIILLDNEIEIAVDGGNAAIVTEEIKESCPSCGTSDCNYDCDGSHYDDYRDNVVARLAFNQMVDGIEALLLSLACEGVDLEASSVQRAISAAIESCANQADRV